MRLKLGLLVSVVALGVSAFAATATPASAATSGIPITGVTCTVQGTTTPALCSLALTGFQVINGALNAVFTLTNTATGQTATFNVPITTATGTCQILNLTLGPIDLNLLGLHVTTNQINLNITAESGPGNLLGNLLCSVAHLLDQNQLGALSRLLNNLLNGGLLTGL